MSGQPAIGLLLPNRPDGDWDARYLVDLAVEAQQLGFDSVWAGESVAKGRQEPLTLLAAVASAAPRLHIGTAALMPAIREPVSQGRAIATLDQLTSGRLIAGVGAGFPNPTTRAAFEMVGTRFSTRARLLDDIVGLWRHTWSQDGGRPYHGPFLDYEWLPEPLPAHAPGGPPIWLAGGGPTALERAGHLYDGWLPYPRTPADYADGRVAVDRVAEGAGRDARQVTKALFLTVLIEPDPERAAFMANDYCLAIYGMSFKVIRTIQAWVVGPATEIVNAVGQYVRSGAEHIIIRVASLAPDLGLGVLAQTIRPLRTECAGVPSF